jgi:kynurenine formamidase
MAVYPGDPQPEFDPYATIEGNKANVTRIMLGSHTGTHVDAPHLPPRAVFICSHSMNG